MPDFLGDNYLIGNTPGRDLFAAVRDLPVVDAHNHADVLEIHENRNYTDIWELEAQTDHYVWAALRARGVPENLITGTAAPADKWQAAAAVWPDLAGTATYEWVHLDLQRLFGITTPISADTADEIWTETSLRLQDDDMKPQSLLRTMKIESMCSTDDPLDSLEHHRALTNSGFDIAVRPTFRPDRAMNIEHDGWQEYIQRLEARFDRALIHVADLATVLQEAHDFFGEHGCVTSDHGLHTPYALAVEESEANTAFHKARRGEALSDAEVVRFRSFILHLVAAMDTDKNWVMQLHIGALRDVRTVLFESAGPDSGGDICDPGIPVAAPLKDLLNRFDGSLKVALYALDPALLPSVTSLARAFGGTVRVGAAWWFNDTPWGMKQQLEYIAGVDPLINLAGMVSDSRKLVSYGSRHEMFRRVLCDVLGGMVEAGRMPQDAAKQLAVKMAYQEPKEFFGLG